MSAPWRVLALPPVPHAVMVDLFDPDRRADLEVVTPAERTQEEVARLLPDVDVVLGDWSPSLRLLDPGPRVCFVQQPSVGVDGIDVDACTAAGVPVANCAGANTTSVAEWCLSATLALLRRVPEADAAVRAGSWPQTALGGRELAGSRVGVVGMGPSAGRPRRLFAAFGCDVVHWSRTRRDDAPAPWVELDELLIDERRGGARHRPRGGDPRPARRGGARAAQARRARRERRPRRCPRRGRPGPRPRGRSRRRCGARRLPRRAAAGRLRRCGRRRGCCSARTPPARPCRPSSRILQQTNANLRRVLDGEPVVDVVNGLPARVVRRPERP